MAPNDLGSGLPVVKRGHSRRGNPCKTTQRPVRGAERGDAGTGLARATAAAGLGGRMTPCRRLHAQGIPASRPRGREQAKAARRLAGWMIPTGV